jgi:hypothetical protein
MAVKQDLDGLVSDTCSRGNRMGVIALIQIIDETIEQKLWAGLIKRADQLRKNKYRAGKRGVSPSKIGLNRIQAIRDLEMRATVFFTSKIYALNTLKMSSLLRS